MASTIDLAVNPTFATAWSIEVHRMQQGQDDTWRQLSSADPNQDANEPDEEPVCANCGGTISMDDLVCPHCGISLVSG